MVICITRVLDWNLTAIIQCYLLVFMLPRYPGGVYIHFEGYWGVVQCNPLSLNLFNDFSKDIVRNWLKIVAEEASGPEVFELLVQIISSFFFAGGFLVVSMQME